MTEVSTSAPPGGEAGGVGDAGRAQGEGKRQHCTQVRRGECGEDELDEVDAGLSARGADAVRADRHIGGGLVEVGAVDRQISAGAAAGDRLASAAAQAAVDGQNDGLDGRLQEGHSGERVGHETVRGHRHRQQRIVVAGLDRGRQRAGDGAVLRVDALHIARVLGADGHRHRSRCGQREGVDGQRSRGGTLQMVGGGEEAALQTADGGGSERRGRGSGHQSLGSGQNLRGSASRDSGHRPSDNLQAVERRQRDGSPCQARGGEDEQRNEEDE